MSVTLGYVNVFVRDFSAALAFYRDELGLSVNYADDGFGYASFSTGSASLAVIATDDPGLIGRHTGVGLVVEDLDATYAALRERVTFDAPPAKQPWGGYMALFRDPDGNVFYLDQAVTTHK